MNSKNFKKQNETDALFKIDSAAIILILVILIPVVYTLVTNLQKPTAPPVIKSSVNSSPLPLSQASNIEAALKAVVDNPGYQTYLNLGLGYYNTFKYSESIKAWEKALEYNPKSELAYNNIAAAYGAMNKWDEEIDACKKALAINPKLDIARRNLDWAQNMKNKK